MRKVYKTGVERFDVSAGKIFEKTAEGNEMVSLGKCGKIFVADVVSVAVELEAVPAIDFGGDVLGLKIVVMKNVRNKVVKAKKVKAVVFDSFFGAATFDFDVFEKVAD